MFNDHKQYVEWLEGSMLKRLARDFSVGYEQVTCLGETQETLRRVTICAPCRVRRMQALIYFKPLDEPISYRMEFSIDLVPHYRMLDNTYVPRVWLILAGQCGDCGHVYYIYMLQKEGNFYIG